MAGVRYFLLLLLCWGLSVAPLHAAVSTDADYENMELFTDVYSLIRQHYVEQTDPRQLIEGAVRGMLETLDPHSSYLSADLYEEMQIETQGEFGGIGIEVTVRDHRLLVIAPLEGSPAAAAGIKPGDEIVSIDGAATADMEDVDATRRLRGAVGEEVTLQVRRAKSEELISFTLVRKMIQIDSVSGRLLDDKYGYVRLAQFQKNSGNDLQERLQALAQQTATQQLRGLILDLRNNPGGLLEQAVVVSDLFLKEGLIVYTEGRADDEQYRFTARNDGNEPDCPLIVLINSGSASAAEIVAGALQDHKRALIVGAQSFGKGSVQSIIPLGDDSALRLTTARYYTPSGRSIQALGIRPDLIINGEDNNGAGKDDALREADLPNHFAARQERETSLQHGEKQEAQGDADMVLEYALNLLKGFELLGQVKNN